MINKIIVEGPDCSGKSTLVERLKNSLRWDAKSLHHKDSPSWSDKYFQFKRYLSEYATNDKTILDRSHFSEIVYSELWRDELPFTSNEKLLLNGIAQHNSLIILACPNLETLQKRYLSRNYPQQIKLEELEPSRKLFFRELRNIPYILYKSESYEELNNLVTRVKNEAIHPTD